MTSENGLALHNSVSSLSPQVCLLTLYAVLLHPHLWHIDSNIMAL